MQHNRPISTRFIQYDPAAGSRRSTTTAKRKYGSRSARLPPTTRRKNLEWQHSQKNSFAEDEQDDDRGDGIKTEVDAMELVRMADVPYEPSNVDRDFPRQLLQPGPDSLPLNMLSIRTNAIVVRGVQHFVQVYAPFVQQRPKYALAGTDYGLLKDLVPFTLQSPMLLSAMIAMMELILNMSKTTVFVGPNKNVVRYSTEAVTHLQEKIRSAETQASDEVILTILVLVGIEFYNRNWGRTHIHMQALNRMIDLRGGLENLGFDGYVKHTILAYQAYYNQQKAEHEQQRPKRTVEYPRHPFSPTLCEKMAFLPIGLSEFAMTGKMCLVLIDACYAAQLDRPTQSAHGASSASPHKRVGKLRPETIGVRAANVIETLGIPALSPLEQIIALALMAFCAFSDDKRHMFRLLNPYLQVHSASIVHAGEGLRGTDNVEKACLIWAAVMLSAATRPDTWSQRLAAMLLDFNAKALTWASRVQLCENFFWDVGLAEQLTTRVEELDGGPK